MTASLDITGTRPFKGCTFCPHPEVCGRERLCIKDCEACRLPTRKKDGAWVPPGIFLCNACLVAVVRTLFPATPLEGGF